jgi:hypothetical protein
MATQATVISVGGWKGAPVTLTFATGHEAAILREALVTYLRLWTMATGESHDVCEQAVEDINDQLRALAAPVPPTPSLSPTSMQASATGGASNTFNVATDGDPTAWIPTANNGFLTIVSPLVGMTGDGTVVFAVAPNADPATRQGTITVLGFGLTFSVTQEGAEE